MFLPIVIGAAAAVDSFAAGLWVGHKWGSAKTAEAAVVNATAAVASATERAITIPAGGVETIVKEIADDAQAVAQKVAGVGGDVGSAVQAVEDLHTKLDGLLATAKTAAPK